MNFAKFDRYVDRHARSFTERLQNLCRMPSVAARGSGPPVSLGTFNTDSSGRALATLTVPAGLRIAVTAVTEEPAGGSPQPTTTPFLAATWKSE